MQALHTALWISVHSLNYCSTECRYNVDYSCHCRHEIQFNLLCSNNRYLVGPATPVSLHCTCVSNGPLNSTSISYLLHWQNPLCTGYFNDFPTCLHTRTAYDLIYICVGPSSHLKSMKSFANWPSSRGSVGASTLSYDLNYPHDCIYCKVCLKQWVLFGQKDECIDQYPIVNHWGPSIRSFDRASTRYLGLFDSCVAESASYRPKVIRKDAQWSKV